MIQRVQRVLAVSLIYLDLGRLAGAARNHFSYRSVLTASNTSSQSGSSPISFTG